MTSWTAPKTWTGSSALTAAELNEQVRDNTLHLKEQLTGHVAILSSDFTTSSSTFTNLTGLSFSCTSGVNYNIQVFLTYKHSSTSGGPVIAANHPGGGLLQFMVYSGDTSAVDSVVTQVDATDSGAGIPTVDTANAVRVIRGWVRYQCTATGTFSLRAKVNTAGTLTVEKGSAMTIAND